MLRRRRLLPVAVAASVLGTLLAFVSGAAGSAAAAPPPGPRQSYIVTLRLGVFSTSSAAGSAGALGGRVEHVYTHVLQGFSVSLPSTAVAALASRPDVAAVEPDLPVHATTTQYSPPSYGLDRVDQRQLPLSKSYTYSATGAGVTAYVIDTGIRRSHTDFGGRAVTGYDAVVPGGTADDCNGHGTHVSGTLGGQRFGIAKGVRLVAVRVLDCAGNGSTSGVIAGLDWVTGNHRAGTPAVANMSLGGGASAALDTAVQKTISDGVTVAVAAGNGDAAGNPVNACSTSPARVGPALTVSATDAGDRRAYYANYGSCVDLFAPGNNITSDWWTSNTATNTESGTSMATPHAAGVAALYLQRHPAATPAAVATAVRGNATAGVVKYQGANSPNRLLFTNY